MAFLDDVAERIAVETFETAEATGDHDLIDAVRKTIGDTSPTLEEAYNTCIRYLQAEARAKALLRRRTQAGPS